MKIDILTLFPKLYEGFIEESIIGRAIQSKKAEINIYNIREYAKNKHKKVDDTPYGGGAGMILMCQPIFDAVENLRTDKTKVVLMSPQGVLYDQKLAYTLSKEEHLIFICGHYEGFEERINSIVDMEISIGDYILTGGELPSMVVTDSIVRLLPGVIDEKSHQIESFKDSLLDHSNYTKPREYKGMKVPHILLSGHHQKIEKWRQTERIIKTMEKRPDLINRRSSYYLYREIPIKKITYFNYLPEVGFDVSPKNNAKRKDVITVRHVILFNKLFIEKIVKLKIERKIKLYLKQLYELTTTDDDTEETRELINNILNYKKYLIENYVKYLSIDYSDLIMKKMQLLLNELRVQQHLKVSTPQPEKNDRVK